MKVVVIDFAASEGGAFSILKDFYDQAKLHTEIDWTFILSDLYIEETSNVKVIIYPKDQINRLNFDFFEGKRIINKLKPDVVFNLQNTYVYGIKSPQVIYLHQPLPFQKTQNFSFFKKKERKYAIIQHVLGFLIKKGLVYAEKIIVQTEWMKEEVSKLNNVSSEKIFVIPPTITELEKSNSQNFKNNVFFYPTSNIPYKNNDFLIEVVKEINEQYPKLDFKLNITLNSNEKIKNVNYLGRISRTQVFNEMSNSVLVFPSAIETYGMPLMEARKIGTRVIAGDTSFGRELLKDYSRAYFFDLNNRDSLKKIMIKSIRGELIDKPISSEKKKNDSTNSWEKVIHLLANSN